MLGYPLAKKVPHLIALTRLNRPIGVFLLLWPALWALWLAAEGVPRLDVLLIFVLGTFLTRSAGCAINDFADRKIDGHVARTRDRPLASGALSAREALLTTAVLMALAFVLVLFTNALTIQLSFIAVVLACAYPFAKRVTQLPQIVLGAAFGIAIPMAFAAQSNHVPPLGWALYGTAVLWTVAYDTLYAMADREDDLKIGVRSTAVLFGRADLLIVGVLQALVIALLAVIGIVAGRGWLYALGLIVAAGLAIRQLYWVRDRDPEQCFAAFLDNNWLGLAVFIGLAADYAFESPALGALGS